MKSLLESKILDFLQSGGLIALPSAAGTCPEFSVGWGELKRCSEGPQTLGGLSENGAWFYAPDFFLKDSRPWWGFSNSVRISRDDLLSILERASALSPLSESRWDESLQAPELDRARFSQIFSELQMRISSAELTKGVPYVFQKVPTRYSQPKERLKLLVNLLRNTSGAPLQIYGVWSSSEGILGASPEILFSQKGERVETVALAGTRVRDQQGDQQGSLLDDPKERWEHQVVVDGVVQSLRANFEGELGEIEKSEIHELQLPTLTHLCTPITFRLNADASGNTFDRLVRALHPTPALGAFPKHEGLSWLAEVEAKIPRGRFGAPFGVVVPALSLDSNRSQFHCLVAIRNLQWDTQSARIGAGCGVVAASQLDREWNEVQGKLKAVRKLLGMESGSEVQLAVPPQALGPNLTLAIASLKEAYRLGVRELCICPGARNAPWIAVLSENPDLFKTYYHFEERSAAFFALGRIRQTGSPMAVLTTSGTAVGELLPAAMEAYYSGLPLVLLTADRPSYYRNSGAPQTAEQVGLFGVYAPHGFDLEASVVQSLEKLRQFRPNALVQPIHINVCFDEPLIDGEVPSLEFAQPDQGLSQVEGQAELQNQIPDEVKTFLVEVRSPVVLVGMLREEEHEAVAQCLLRLGAPVYLEATSGLREDSRLQKIRVQSADGMLERIQKAGLKLDGVIRFGGIPTPRLWRDLEGNLKSVPVLSISSLPFSGLGRESLLWTGFLQENCTLFLAELHSGRVPVEQNSAERFLELDRTAAEQFQSVLLAEPTSQLGMMGCLSRLIPQKSRVYVGNSLPIRDWDLAATSEDRGLQVWASRGLNGIDGQVSSFIGYAAAVQETCSSSQSENWAVLGDLTSLYDLAGPWILPQLRNTPVNIVVVNNGGGKIFAGMFKQKEFQNQHAVQFKAWAELWGLDYELWKEIPVSYKAHPIRSRIIELQPCADATQRVAALRALRFKAH